jgi:hypothetical protein
MTREGAAETVSRRGPAVKDPVSGNLAPGSSVPSDSGCVSAATASATQFHPSFIMRAGQLTANQLLINAIVNERASAEDRKLYVYRFRQDAVFRAQVLKAYKRYSSAESAAERRKANLLAGIVLVFAPELASLFVYEPSRNPSGDELVLRLRATSIAHQVAGEALIELQGIGPETPLGSTPRAPRPSADGRRRVQEGLPATPEKVRKSF